MGSASGRKVERFTADGQSSVKTLRGIVIANTNAAFTNIDLKAGSSSGDILLTFGAPATSGFFSDFFDNGIESPVGNWYVDVTNLTGSVTLLGD